MHIQGVTGRFEEYTNDFILLFGTHCWLLYSPFCDGNIMHLALLRNARNLCDSFSLSCSDPRLTSTLRLGLETCCGNTIPVKVLDIEKKVYLFECERKGTTDVKIPTWAIICRLQSSHPNVKVGVL